MEREPPILKVLELVKASQRKIPAFVEISALVTTNGLFGRRARGRGVTAGLLLARGKGGGTEGGGKLTCLFWQFLGIAAVCQVPLNGSTKTIFKFGMGMPTKFALCSCGIYSAARLAVGSG